MCISPDEDLTSYVHVAHGLEVSSQTNSWGSMAAAGEVDASAILLIWLRKPYCLAHQSLEGLSTPRNSTRR
jgi:hypothetical protein